MDMTNSIIPKSDQQNYDDYANGITRTVTIAKVSAGSAEQPVDIHLEEFPGRAYRPSKSMRRVLVSAWGSETSVYVGRKMTLYGDPTVKFGGVALGGIKISHLSHIDKPLKIALTVTRGKREPFTVTPLLAKTVDTKSAEIVDSVDRPSESVDSAPDRTQMALIGALFEKLGMSEGKIQLAYVSDVLERVVTHANQLTTHEVGRVIAYLEKDAAKQLPVDKGFDQTALATEAEAKAEWTNGDE